jgi:subtilisin-like proprotein convertase family protein/subtilisin family serine protease
MDKPVKLLAVIPMDGIVLKKLNCIRALVIGAVAVVPAVTHVARAQDRSERDLADRVLRGPKAVKRIGVDPDLPKDTDEYLVALKPGADPWTIAGNHGLAARARMHSDGWFLLKGRGSERAKDVIHELQSDPDVLIAGVNQKTNFKRFGFSSNDPFFLPNIPTSGWQGQWHLQNNIGGTIDADVKPAWDAGWTGTNVVIGIVDDCLQKAHPDLSPNFTPSNSYDFGQNDTDPSPVYGTDQHGTSVAGVAAARGGNGIGVTGAAPLARLAGLRVDFSNQTSQQFVDATLFHTSSTNEAIKIENHSYGYTGTFIATPLEKQALATSAAQETIHVFAAGNERGNRAQDSNTLDLQSSSDSITVAALGEDGKVASYSSFGSNVFVCAPSSSNGLPGITTTDVMGGNGYNPSDDTFPDPNYTTVFGGTSSAAPLVTGILALAKQANPNLNERLAKHLLVRSSNVVDPADSSLAGGWKTNAAGFAFNENYGFGCIDASRLVNNALIYQGVTKLQTEVGGPFADGRTIPDNDSAGISHTFTIAGKMPVEDIELQSNITHPYRGDLEIWLRSPRGTWSRLKSTALGATTATSDSGANIHWTFSSNAFWGEVPAGTWTVLVKDLGAGDVGTFDDFSFVAHMGTIVLKDDANFTGQTVPTTMISGQTYTIPLVAQNSGYSTWTSPAWYLRSENPSANTTWGTGVVNLSLTDSIAPGFSKTFNIKVVAPMIDGTYDFQWRMRHSAYTSFGNFSPDVSVVVTVVPDAARYMTISTLPASVTAGASFPVTVTIRNVGTNAWIAGSPYHLKAMTSSTKWGNPTVSLADGDNVARGSDKAFTFTAIAPPTPGTYVMQWRMENGTTQFGELSPGFKIKVVAP